MQLPLFLLSLIGLTVAVVLPSSQQDESSTLSRRAGPKCTTFKVPISASAQNRKVILPPNFDATSNPLGQLLNSIEASGETGLGNVLGDAILTSGTYQINMQYCVPEVYNKSRADTLQCGSPLRNSSWLCF
jgi:hypothetical protein